jgi:hypothetical protein
MAARLLVLVNITRTICALERSRAWSGQEARARGQGPEKRRAGDCNLHGRPRSLSWTVGTTQTACEVGAGHSGELEYWSNVNRTDSSSVAAWGIGCV